MSPSPNEALPIHLAEHPQRKGLSRLGVGTTVFNAAAVLLLVTMSSFVVIGSAYAPDEPADDQFAIPGPPEPNYDQALAGVARMAAATTTSTTTTEPPPPTTEAPPVPVARPAVRAAGHEPEPEPAPRPVTCDRFTTQPESQATFDQDPAAHVGLDGDGDGIACEHLPGRPVAPPPPSYVVPTKAEIVRPPTRLYGVHTREAPFAMHEVESFSTTAGKAPNNVLFFTNFSRGFPVNAVENAWGAGMFPIATFEPIVEGADGAQPKLSEITSGKWDAYFTEWATAAKATGKPVGFRFGQEMNGNWYTWSDGRFGNANGDFVQAWRHIHDLFDAAGADNVLWIWSVNRIDTLPDKSLWRVYPGADYVDWVGISGYYRSDSTAPTFDNTFGATLEELRNVAPGKLVMLTEVGAGTTEANRVEWINSLFAGLLEHQEIIGFTWFNDFKAGGDWKIEFSQATTAAFATGVADPRYGPLARQAGV